MTPATSRWRPRALFACSDPLTSKSKAQICHQFTWPLSQKRAYRKPLIRMIENKNHLNTKSNNDNKDKVPRKWHFGCRACMCCHLSTLTLCDPMNFSPPGSSAHGRTPPPCPPPGDLHNPGIKPMSLKSPALAGRFFTTSATREALDYTEEKLDTLSDLL